VGVRATALVVAAVLSACTSTLQHRSAHVSTGRTGATTDAGVAAGADVTGQPGSTGDATAGGGTLNGGPPTPGSPSAPGRFTTGSGASGGATRTGGSAPGPAGGTIKIGIVTLNVAGLQDAKGLDNGDNRAQAQAVVDTINATGGIAGRRVVAVFAQFDASSANWEADYQAVCTSLTEDSKVFAVVNASVAYARTFVPCLAQHDVPLISSGGGRGDDRQMKDWAPYLYHPGSADLTRAAHVYIDSLATRGFFGAGARVGLVRVDDAAFERVTNAVIRPRLAAAGVDLTDDAAVAAQSSLGQSASQMPSIVLRFQREGINRVLFLDNATLGVLFTLQASSQAYRPRYGFNTLSNPVLIQQNVSADGLDGSLGVGWQPTQDVAERDDPNPPAAAKRCTDIMSKAGQGGVSRTGQWAERMYCDELFFLQLALDGASSLTPATLASRVAALGTRHQSPMTFTTRFGPGRPDGAASARATTYDRACSCFRYGGPMLAFD
jgi:ABC-type branched-subunit amino acid transport system substrate-binding protein